MDDDALLARLLAGDEAAFAELVRRHHTSMVRVASMYVVSEATAEDVAQETWMAVVRGVERFEGRSSFKTWLFRILTNRAKTIGTRERRSVPVDPMPDVATELSARFDEGGTWSDPPAPFTDVIDGRLSDAEALEAVRASLRALPEPYQAVVTLRDIEGLSTREVADLLELSEANVRVILHRGRSKIRADVENATRGGGR